MYSGVSPIFLQQIENSKDKDYLQVVIMCLGNLCGDEKCRNILLSSRMIGIVLGVLNKVVNLWIDLIIVCIESGYHGKLYLLFA